MTRIIVPPRRLMLGCYSTCIHSVLERIIPRYYHGLPAYWCHGERPTCRYRRINLKGEAVCTRNVPRGRRE